MTEFAESFDANGLPLKKEVGGWTTLKRAHLVSYDIWKYVNFHPLNAKPTNHFMEQQLIA